MADSLFRVDSGIANELLPPVWVLGPSERRVMKHGSQRVTAASASPFHQICDVANNQSKAHIEVLLEPNLLLAMVASPLIKRFQLYLLFAHLLRSGLLTDGDYPKSLQRFLRHSRA